MSEFKCEPANAADDDLLDYEYWEAPQRPSKAAERRSWKEEAQKELEELGDLYPELAEVLNEVRF
ncbi:hypothetical protein RGQ21_67620 [Kitasatospora aureofaciens]|nr:hypothetical protein RGQ21_67620 [Kitasatospora aureofaciens]